MMVPQVLSRKSYMMNQETNIQITGALIQEGLMSFFVEVIQLKGQVNPISPYTLALIFAKKISISNKV